jgi:hypothetical protein
MFRAEHDPRDEVTERDVGGHRNRPSLREVRPGEYHHEGQVDGGRADHAAKRRHQGHGRTASRV